MTNNRQRFSFASFASFTSTSSSSSTSSRRNSTASTDQPSACSTGKQVLPTIPFAVPPFMPMYQPRSAIERDTAVELEGERRGIVERRTERRLSISTRPAANLRGSSQSTSPLAAPLQSQTPPSPTQRQPKRFLRRLQRKAPARDTNSGRVGDWSDGPSDLSSSYYDLHHSRQTSSSSCDFPSLTHSRGHSASSSNSFSTCASSLPPSPTFACSVSIAPQPSRVPLSPRTASKKRFAEEAAAVDAVNDYFAKVRLSQIEEDAPLHTVTITDNYTAPPPSTCRAPVPRGLAISGFDKKPHHRSVSRELEIDFLETGHTTFTPLSADSPSYSSAILLPEDAFFNSTSDDGMCYDIDTSEDTLTSSTCTSARTPIPEQDIGPALDELSTFFASPTTLSSPVASREASTLPPLSSPHLYSSSRRPDSFQCAKAALQARQASRPVSYDWI
ncbi:uncharacterized protein JCM15063_005871 [Sporobolomyces koalae]|uniref:uncharacterized protein n=1 Tax=Sporobolomyces koalae TaxID=500713 RepID=UPI00316D0929